MKIREEIEVPIIDLSKRSEASKQIVEACEKLGFFKVINHGVPQEIISRTEEEAHAFFSKPGSEKQRAGPPNPYGYGSKNIGPMGDVGELEYLILQTNSPFLSSFSHDFRCAVKGYVEAVKKLACEILDMMVEGLMGGGELLSALISHTDSDSILRFNHYPPTTAAAAASKINIGFGEHTDPQILTLLRSNAVQGLQIALPDALWLPVSPHPPDAFCVNVGDILQVMTNGRFRSVKHRVAVQSPSRMSMAYFAAPPLQATIGCLPGMATPEKPPLFRSFSWGEYKQAASTTRLGDCRLNLFASS